MRGEKGRDRAVSVQPSPAVPHRVVAVARIGSEACEYLKHTGEHWGWQVADLWIIAGPGDGPGRRVGRRRGADRVPLHQRVRDTAGQLAHLRPAGEPAALAGRRVQNAGVAGEPCRDDAADATTETAQPWRDPRAGTHIGHRRQALEA